MQVPTAQNYPDFPRGNFKNPKGIINDAIQGLAEIGTQFTNLAAGAFKCILSYKSATLNEEVVGEGMTKVI